MNPGAGVISIPDTAQDTDLHKMSAHSSLLELGDVRGRLMVQLRSRGVFSGFWNCNSAAPPVSGVLKTLSYCKK